MDGKSLDITQERLNKLKEILPDKFSETRDEYLSRIGDRDETGYMTREGLFRTNSKDSGHYHSNWLSMMYPVAT